MVNEKNGRFGLSEEEHEEEGSQAPRARNRTVMLSPDVTGDFRARIAEESSDTVIPPLPEGGVDVRQESAGDQAQAIQPPVEPSQPVVSPPLSNQQVPHQPISPPAPPRPTFGGGVGGGILSQAATHESEFVSPSQLRETAAASIPVSAPAPTPTPEPEAFASLPSGDAIIWEKEAPVVGFLVSYDKNPNGDVFILKSGRMVVTSEQTSSGNIFLIADESVSPMHAIVRISSVGEVQVLDQLSEFGTTIKRFGSEESISLSGDKSTLEHGDVVSFGNRRFHVCLVPLGV